MKDYRVKIAVVVALGAMGVAALCFLEPSQAKDTIDGIINIFTHM